MKPNQERTTEHRKGPSGSGAANKSKQEQEQEDTAHTNNNNYLLYLIPTPIHRSTHMDNGVSFWGGYWIMGFRFWGVMDNGVSFWGGSG